MNKQQRIASESKFGVMPSDEPITKADRKLGDSRSTGATKHFVVEPDKQAPDEMLKKKIYSPQVSNKIGLLY